MCPAGWIVSGTGVLQNPEQVLTPAARARLAQVLDERHARSRSLAPTKSDRGRPLLPVIGCVWHMVADSVNDFAWATAKKFVWQATRANIPGKGYVPVHQVLPARPRGALRECARHHPSRARVLLGPLVPVSVPAAHAAGRTERRHGIPDGDQLQFGRGRSRDRAPVVADGGEQQRDVVRLDGRGIQSVHEHPLGRRQREEARRISTDLASRTAASAATNPSRR